MNQDYCNRGYRLIALAYRELSQGSDYNSMSRSQLESGLTFLGILVLENRVKPDSGDVIKMLNTVNMRQVMITGKKCVFFSRNDFLSLFNLSSYLGNF